MKRIESGIFSLENFEGPLDFLLFLIQKGEINIHDVVIRSILGQYLENNDARSNLNEETLNSPLEIGAEFISSTATLLLLKSKGLLPPEEIPEESKLEEGDPRFEIIHQLLDYCRFKQLAKELSEREERQNNFFTRGYDPSEEYPKKFLGIEHITLDELSQLFKQALDKAVFKKGVIQEEIWKVSAKIHYIREILEKQDSLNFMEMLMNTQSKDELIVSFLAVLELMKLGHIAVLRNDKGHIALFKQSENAKNIQENVDSYAS